jgi:hypothetical protein
MSALEAAGARAVAAGDAVLAAQMFANAALVAEEVGLAGEGRRLRARVTDLASLARAGGSGRSPAGGPLPRAGSGVSRP